MTLSDIKPGDLMFEYEADPVEPMRMHRLDVGHLRALGVPFNGARFELAPGDASPLDSHEETEIWICLSGSGRLGIDDATRPFGAGDTVCFTPWQAHRVENTGADRLVVLTVWWPV